jgi:hypothetical protein
MGNIQQLDSQCIIWLTRQPGITAAQKAGTKQKLMAVVRKENYDILENRVLKKMLKLCASECQHYLREYEKQFAESSRIKAVKRLYAMTQQGLKLEFFSAIGVCAGIPKPNYVFLHDLLYSQTWQMFLALLRQTALMENAWQYRNRLLQEYFLFCFANVVQFEREEFIMFNSEFWIAVDVKNNGQFIKKSNFRKFFAEHGVIGQFITKYDGDSVADNAAEIKYGNKCWKVSLIHLPESVEISDLQITSFDQHIYFIFAESNKKITPQHQNIVFIEKNKDLFYQLDDWFVNLLGTAK